MGTDPGPRLPDTLDDFRALTRSRLEGFPRREVPDSPGMRRAAVVLCVVAPPDEPLSVIVIKRAYRGRNAGQWGLPGGRIEPGESPGEAAVRELHEELGLRSEPGEILGILDDFPATSGFSITPIVTTLGDITRLRPSPEEVHSVHLVHLTRLAAEDTPHWVRPEDGDPDTAPQDPPAEEIADLLQMRLGPRMTIHAPTGAMLWQFREVVLLGRSPEAARVAGFRQPDWTRR